MSDASGSEPELPPLGFAESLTADERRSLGSFGEFITASEGDVIIEEGHEQDSLFLIVFGTFHVQTDTTGRPVLLGNLKSGDTIGEVNIFDSGKASASVVAKSISQVWKIDRSRLESFLESNPEAATRLLVSVATQLSKRLRRANEKAAMAREAVLDAF
ncbi:MAG: cyclic nucleotide-binding domain-containing protein [Verrucomicrobiales bacterium]|nr:cyclic nucleotide-binding domain-containing protein [Verrucomicrobiales bacterium]